MDRNFETFDFNRVRLTPIQMFKTDTLNKCLNKWKLYVPGHHDIGLEMMI
jgi:hypothetical protein